MKQQFYLILAPLILLFHFDALALCVTAPIAHLHKEPNSKSPVTWTAAKFTPLLEVERTPMWYKVKDVDGEEHWILKKLAGKSFDCISVKSVSAPLYIGPGTTYKYAPLSVADKYFPFKKVNRDGAWLKIQDDYGLIYWIHENHVWEPLKYSSINF